MEGQRIGPYRLERKLGAGGMGVVYAAWDERLERRVALKQIRPEMASDPLRRERFRREARAVAQLDHPAIVRIHDLLETAEGDWLVLQYVEGPTLAQRRHLGALPAAAVAELARDVLGALAEAHSRGLLHRDLKAENVVLAPSGRAMLLDFGLAKLYAPEAGEAGAAAGESAPGTAGVVGTYRSMSPEQANGLALDPRSDLFSLGVLLYEAATGVSPFLAGTPVATLTRVCAHLQAPARELAPALPEALSALIDNLLEKDPGRRPQSAGEALAEVSAGAGTGSASRPGLASGTGPRMGSTATESDDAASTCELSPPRPSPAAPAAIAPPSIAASPASAAPYRGLRARRLPLVSSLALLAVAGVFVAWRLRSAAVASEPLYVAVARPQVGLGAGREDVVLAAAALQAASLRALSSLEGVAALSPGPPEPGEPAATVQRLSRLLAAGEVLTSTLECQARQCQAVLRRQRGADGKVLDSTVSFEVPLTDLHLLDAAAATYLKPLYPGFATRAEASQVRVRGEDYQRYLRAQRRWDEERPADLEPLLAELDRVRAGSPLFLDAYLLEARIEGHRFFQTRDAGRLEHALGLLGEARRLAPGDPLPLVTQFGVELNAGRLDEAEEILRELDERLPGDVWSLERRALLLEQRGDRQGASTLLRAAVERRPSAGFLLALANLQTRLGEIPAARGTLEELLRRVPGYLGGETLLAQLELEAGSPARAAELYASLARRHPGFAVFSNLGLSQLLLGRYGEAAESLRRAGSLAPQSYAAALNQGDVEILLGRRSDAAASYRRVLLLVSGDASPDGWQQLAAAAQAEAHLGRGKEAAADIQRAVVAAPSNPEVAYDAALVYAVIGDRASAAASAERAMARGYDRRWLSLPWFQPLRQDPSFRQLLDGEAGSGPRAAIPAPAAR